MGAADVQITKDAGLQNTSLDLFFTCFLLACCLKVEDARQSDSLPFPQYTWYSTPTLECNTGHFRTFVSPQSILPFQLSSD